jgi:hypothetical protein
MFRDPPDIGCFEPGGILLAAIRASKAIYLFKGLLVEGREPLQDLVLIGRLQQSFIRLFAPGGLYFPVVQHIRHGMSCR